MESQRVKSVNYLCVVEIPPENVESKSVVVLPQGAEVVSVNLQIKGSDATGKLSIGLEGEHNYFLNDIAAAKGFTQSAKLATLSQRGHITATLKDFAKDSTARATLRVQYFAPSSVLVEY